MYTHFNFNGHFFSQEFYERGKFTFLDFHIFVLLFYSGIFSFNLFFFLSFWIEFYVTFIFFLIKTICWIEILHYYNIVETNKQLHKNKGNVMYLMENPRRNHRHRQFFYFLWVFFRTVHYSFTFLLLIVLNVRSDPIRSASLVYRFE